MMADVGYIDRELTEVAGLIKQTTCEIEAVETELRKQGLTDEDKRYLRQKEDSLRQEKNSLRQKENILLQHRAGSGADTLLLARTYVAALQLVPHSKRSITTSTDELQRAFKAKLTSVFPGQNGRPFCVVLAQHGIKVWAVGAHIYDKYKADGAPLDIWDVSNGLPLHNDIEKLFDEGYLCLVPNVVQGVAALVVRVHKNCAALQLPQGLTPLRLEGTVVPLAEKMPSLRALWLKQCMAHRYRGMPAPVKEEYDSVAEWLEQASCGRAGSVEAIHRWLQATEGHEGGPPPVADTP
eukprot:TRINITY_DN23679_c0_g1_i1.p1 TRINITY_DN23679_c0_g1~~TRINITY_DN23679_c0_g1_i1.p1  ORF type:complete len:295 (-),score=47.83 TRINITY_DN23679_c0_g1_i1:123-1007(-)